MGIEINPLVILFSSGASPQVCAGRGKAVFVVAPSPAAVPDPDRAE